MIQLDIRIEILSTALLPWITSQVASGPLHRSTEPLLHRCMTGSNTEVVEKRTLGNILAIHPGKSIGVSKKLDGFGVSAKVFRNDSIEACRGKPLDENMENMEVPQCLQILQSCLAMHVNIMNRIKTAFTTSSAFLAKC